MDIQKMDFQNIRKMRKIWNWIVSIPKDKLLHDYAGALICLYAFAVAFRFLAFWPAFIIGNAAALFALMAKEIYDAYHPETETAELKDFLFGVFGAVKVDIALLVMFL